jgi:hypothetical protein
VINDIHPGPLPDALRLVLEAMSAVIDVGGDVLAKQAAAARITSASPTYIDVEVPLSCPAGPWSDGPLSLSPTVVDDRGQAVGSILVWVSGGRISFLEQPWYTDDPPTDWPSIERIRLS